ncbi:MFS transporter [Nonomuraea sp. NPDC050451]|uniref:MFS transporter n=1 Tax=Nonomuraea sp. NPDC050451 TaxID=3364364 RepID=UPI0037957A37
MFGSLALAGMVFAMLQALVGPALPVIGGKFNASTADISWVVTAYLLAAAVATPVAGRLGDMFGRRRVLLVVLGTLAAGTLVAALAGNLAVLVTGRVLQGVGGGRWRSASSGTSCRASGSESLSAFCPRCSGPAQVSAPCWPGRSWPSWTGTGCSGSR